MGKGGFLPVVLVSVALSLGCRREQITVEKPLTPSQSLTAPPRPVPSRPEPSPPSTKPLRPISPRPEPLPSYHHSGAWVSYKRTRVLGIACRVIRIPTTPTGCFITFVVAKSHGVRHMPFQALVHRSPVMPQVAVAGTFFSEKNWLPIGEIIVDRRRVHYGGVGHAFGVYPSKRTVIFAVPLHHHMTIGRLRNALRTGPRLVSNMQIRTDYQAQGFRDPHVLVSLTRRCGVGVRQQGFETVIIITEQAVSLKTFAQMFLVLNCHDAVNLDAGASLCLYLQGRILIHPQRDLTNIVVAF